MGWVSDGVGGLCFLMMAVAVSGGLGVFVWEKRYTEKERERDAEEEMQRIKKN